MLFDFIANLSIFFTILLFAGLCPTAVASDLDHFPDVTFKVFSDFINGNFSSKISLATVLTVLFTLTSNSELLNLHARQQNPQNPTEINQVVTGWMNALSRALKEQLNKDSKRLFRQSERQHYETDERVINAIGIKLDALSKLLSLNPFQNGQLQQKLKPVDDSAIQPVHVICPQSMECETEFCAGHSLNQHTRERDIPRVTLIKGLKSFKNVHVLSGKCSKCNTIYYADHESSVQSQGSRKRTKFYLNSAKLLKVGQSIWVDRIFSGAVVNAVYSFHASTSAFSEFWSNSFSTAISRRQVHHTFVQETIRNVAQASNTGLELLDGLPIDEVTKHAFNQLGENGIIRSAENHFCSECTHDYKPTADRITGDDPAALVGVDENQNVPALNGPDADLATRDAAQARLDAENAMAVDQNSTLTTAAPVKLIVMDGIVMGPTVGHIF